MVARPDAEQAIKGTIKEFGITDPSSNRGWLRSK
jgi:hypothetical protein